MTKADTGEFLFDDLRELAANHAQQRVEFEKLIPENISLGLFVVRLCQVKTLARLFFWLVILLAGDAHQYALAERRASPTC